MSDPNHLLALISSHGALILILLAVVEGPIVTVIAASVASLSVISLPVVLLCVVIGDLIGDTALYLTGRFAPTLLPISWARRMGLTRRRHVTLLRSFRDRGPRLLVIGKVTHAAGFAMLLAAGAAKLPFGQFFLINLVTTVPKCIAFMALGYLAGNAVSSIGQWLFWFPIGAVVFMAMALLYRYIQNRSLRHPQGEWS